MRFSIKKFVLASLALALVVGATVFYRAIYPPLPTYLKFPPGSSLIVSRRFHPFISGPKYYCLVRSPLKAQQTANYIMKSSLWRPAVEVLEDKQPSSMNGWALKRNGTFIDVDYEPIGSSVEGGEVQSLTHVWHEANGSTIEFYLQTDF